MMATLSAVVTPLLDGPVHGGVDQVVDSHGQAPLLVAGVEELLAEAGGGAVVDGQHRVAMRLAGHWW